MPYQNWECLTLNEWISEATLCGKRRVKYRQDRSREMRYFGGSMRLYRLDSQIKIKQDHGNVSA